MLLSLSYITLATAGLVSARWSEKCTLPAFAKTVSTAANLSSENALQAIKASADCHQCDVQADGSGYYVPRMFYQHKDGRVEEVANNGLSVEYTAPSYAKPFPAGLTMVAGNPAARTNDPAARSGLTCHGNPSLESVFCPDALTGSVLFQDCWNGRDLVTADNSHVAYSDDGDACPSSHPIKLPSLYLEVVYKVQIVPIDGGHYFLANGDPTGHGFFGIFLSRWNPSVLAAAIRQCGGSYPPHPQSCAPIQASGIDAGARDCPSSGPFTSSQLSSGFTTKTTPPSAILVGPATTTTFTPAPSSTLTFVPVVNSQVFIGCYTDDPDHHTLGFRYTDTVGMTELSCSQNCGDKYAGVVNGHDCYCGYEPSAALVRVSNLECNVPCPGARTESCGGVNRMVLYESG